MTTVKKLPVTPVTLAGQLAEFGLGLRFEDIPAEAVHEAKRRVIDSFACALGAYASAPVSIAMAAMPVLKADEGVIVAGVIGRSAVTSPEWAAFVNGTMIRFLDFNDTYLSKEPAHPSDNIAAALAAGEAGKRNGEEFITAVIAAYEAQCRLCDASSLRARGWDHVTYGAFSATLASAMLLGLSREAAVHAISIAGTNAAALRQTRAGTLSMWKGCAFANTARNAVFAALLARNGMTGPAPVFEGEFGFFKLVSGEFTLPELALKPDGRRFKILDTCIKYYPAEYHAQGAIAAAIELSKEMENIEEIEAVHVRTFRAAYEIIGSGPEKWRPMTRETADHSLPFCAASALLDGAVTVESFSEERLKDERIIRLMDKIKISVDAELDLLYPKAMPANVEVRLKSGQTLSREIIYPQGHPKNPLSDYEVEEKFARLASWYLTDTEIKRTLKKLWGLEKMKDVKELLDLFRKVKRNNGKAKKLKNAD